MIDVIIANITILLQVNAAGIVSDWQDIILCNNNSYPHNYNRNKTSREAVETKLIIRKSTGRLRKKNSVSE